MGRHNEIDTASVPELRWIPVRLAFLVGKVHLTEEVLVPFSKDVCSERRVREKVE